jgi:hypothetical protein
MGQGTVGECGLPGGEREGELGDAADDRPDAHNDHQHERRGIRPDDGYHDAVMDAAWMASGVYDVNDDLIITG